MTQNQDTIDSIIGQILSQGGVLTMRISVPSRSGRKGRLTRCLRRTRRDGRLPERFRAADARKAYPEAAESTFGTFLPKRIFAPVRLDIEIEDRFGNPVVPCEWFLAPLDAIDDAVEKIREGTIIRYQYDASSALLVARQ